VPENATVIQNLIINFDRTIDPSEEFPGFLNVSFSEFEQDFHVEFGVQDHRDSDQTHSYDIYVIDEWTGDPVKYEIQDEEVSSKSFTNKSLIKINL
jgi:hypothetical protein